MFNLFLWFALAHSGIGCAPTDLNYRERWAVVIGIDTYDEARNGLRPLQFAENDAREFGDILQDEFGYGSVDGQTHVRYLVNGEATKENVEKAFTEWLPARGVQADDAVLVFFAGHGLTDDAGAGYLAAVNSKASDLTSCISVEWLRDQLRLTDGSNIPCRHRLVILDCCYSGSLFRSLPPRAAPGAEYVTSNDDSPAAPPLAPSLRDARRIERLAQDYTERWLATDTFQGISAGRWNEPVADGLGQNRHSIFTSTLLEVLRERADSRRPDHVFTFRALAAQVYARVVSAQRSGQLPEFGYLDDSSDGDFLFFPQTHRFAPWELSRAAAEASALMGTIDAIEANDFRTAYEMRARSPDVRPTWEWGYVDQLLHPELARIDLGGPFITEIALSKSGAAAARSAKGDIWYWPAFQGMRDKVPVQCGTDSSTSRDALSAALGKEGPEGVVDLFVSFTKKAVGNLTTSLQSAGAFSRSGLEYAFFCKDAVSFRDASFREVDRLPLLGEVVSQIAYAAEDSVLVIHNRKTHVVRVFDRKTLVEVWRKRVPNSTCIAGSPTDSIVAVGTASGFVWNGPSAIGLLNWKTDTSITLDGHTSTIHAIAFSADGTMLASSGGQLINPRASGEIHTWSVDPPKHLYAAECPRGPVMRIAFSSDSRLISGVTFYGKSVEIWEAASGKQVALHYGHASTVSDVAFFPNSRMVCSASADSTLRVWPVIDDGGPQRRVRTDDSSLVGWSPDSRSTMHLSKEGDTIFLQSLDGDGAPASHIQFPAPTSCIAVDPKTRTYYAGAENRMLYAVHLDSGGKQQASWKRAHENKVISIAWADQLNQLISIGDDGLMKFWKADLTEARESVDLHDRQPRCVASDPGNKFIACALSDGHIAIYDAQTLALLSKVMTGRNCDSVALTSYGDCIVLQGDRALLWERSSGSMLPFPGAHSVGLDSTGTRLAIGKWDRIDVWDIVSRRRLLQLTLSPDYSGPVRRVAFSSDGFAIAADRGRTDVLDGREPMPAVLEDRKAASIVEYYRQVRQLSKADCITALKNDKDISDFIRDRALRMVGERYPR